MAAEMSGPAGRARELQQELYLQDLVLSMYRVYTQRLKDAEGRRILEHYVRSEEDRRRRVEVRLSRQGAMIGSPIRRLFEVLGSTYGRITSRLGTRIMLRIVLAASRRASRRACALVGATVLGDHPELQYLATLRARNEGDLLGELRQHLINTRPRRSS